MSRPRLLAALAALATAATPPVAAAATSGAIFWSGAKGTVICGIESHAPHTNAKWLLCGAVGIPRPSRGGSVGDPFVRVAARGSAQLVLISQTSFAGALEGHLPTALEAGVTWRSLGVSCRIGSRTVRCSNRSGHGFTLGGAKYRPF